MRHNLDGSKINSYKNSLTVFIFCNNMFEDICQIKPHKGLVNLIMLGSRRVSVSHREVCIKYLARSRINTIAEARVKK